MARRRAAEVETHDEHDAVVRWYRERLSEPAVLPWAGLPWEPVRIGPSWQVDDRGRWVLPEATLGWDMLGWYGTALRHQGEPWRHTLEQARLVLWWYAVDSGGKFLFRDMVLQRLKGWGKDPWGACWMLGEAFGPCRVAGMDGDIPIPTDQPDAWVQTAAVALEQTKNTMRLMPSLISPEARLRYGIQVGAEMIHGLGDTRLIQAVTSNPSKLEGGRATAVLLNETQHWRSNNNGHEMAAVLDRNATKSSDGAARTARITNAYEPSDDSVAQHDREAWEKAAAGETLTTGIMYDSLEAPPSAPLTAEAAPDVVRAIRGDSRWLVPERIVQSILDTRNPPSRSRRFWYNQITGREDAWVEPRWFDLCADRDVELDPADELLVFFDGSKSDDATGLVGCRVSDGVVVPLGMWQRPPGLDRSTRWTVPRRPNETQPGVVDVDTVVTEVVDTYRVVGLWCDPSHAKDDVTADAYWDGLIDEWHVRWKDRLTLWAKPGNGGHACLWDMTSPERARQFTVAAMQAAADIEQSARAASDGRPEDRTLVHNGDGRLVGHVRNARRWPNRWGVSLAKESRESPKKVDLAVCMVGARMMRRALVTGAPQKKKRTGRVW